MQSMPTIVMRYWPIECFSFKHDSGMQDEKIKIKLASSQEIKWMIQAAYRIFKMEHSFKNG